MRRRPVLHVLLGALLLLPLIGALTPVPPAAAAPVLTHPRLWLREGDLERLRGWAVASNPIWADGLLPLGHMYRGRMDDGSLLAGDSGSNYGYTPFPVEWAAELFAFLSLVDPSPAARDDWGARARTLLMHIMDRADLGPIAEDRDWRWEHFSTDMRSLFYGEAFPLAVDWLYPRLSAADKTRIRSVFLRWQAENLVATTSGLDHPEPPWLLNDPALLAERSQFRWAGNNFFIAHMNQIGLMALAFDAADDPGDPAVSGDQTRDYLPDAIGAWLYMHHHFSEQLAAGGVPPEGLMYGPTGIGRAAEFLLALQTAGQDDPAVWGPQVSFTTPFWNAIVPALLHTASPAPTVLESWKGPVYLLADHGDAYQIYAQSSMTLLGAMGLHAQYTGNASRLNDVRWLETNLAPGGAGRLVERAGDWNYVRDCILHFMLFDPAAAPLADPRPSLPTSWYAPGTGRVLARTAWGDPEGSWFTYLLGWASIDHQHAAGNMVELWRRGEWLTKQRAGYGMTVGCSDYKNTLAIQNAPAATGIDFWALNNQRGSQYIYGPGDPHLLAVSLADDYVYALGDATELYNNAKIGATDVLEATRSVLWLKPDAVVVYDRAATGSAGRFKRFWLNLPGAPAITGRRAVAFTASGRQRLVIDALLPSNATLAADTAKPDASGYDESADYEPMAARLRLEAPGGPARTAFLTVLQGADAAGAAPGAALLQSVDGTPFAGAVVGAAAVLFPVSLGADRGRVATAGAPFAGVTFRVPSEVSVQYVTGLAPGTGYGVTRLDLGGEIEIGIVPGGTDAVADAAGVLTVGSAPGGERAAALFSRASEDGSVLESSETSERGGAASAGGATIRVGDDGYDRQWRGILSFDTSRIPAGAAIVGATLRVRQAGRKVGNPFAGLGALLADLQGGAIGGNAVLRPGDFQAPAGHRAALTLLPASPGGWYAAEFPEAALAAINRQGVTQVRLRFRRGDDGDRAADYVPFASGEAAEATRPRLVIRYSAP